MSGLDPSVVAYITDIKPSINLLMIGTIWTGILVPLLASLLFMSDKKLRKTPIFYMNLVGVLLGIVLGVINIQIYVSNILNLNAPFNALKTFMVYVSLTVLIPVYVDCILAFRLYVVYPPPRTPRKLLAIIFIPIVIFKLFRIANITTFLVKFGEAIFDGPPGTHPAAVFPQIWSHTPWTKIEWFMQVFDNCYASAWFLWRIGLGVSDTRAIGSRKAANTLKQLFILGISSFVFPCMLSIAQVIIAVRDANFYLGTYVFLTNVYVEIIGVLLATLWAANRKLSQERHNDQTSQSTQLPSTLAFRAGTSPPSSNGTFGHGNMVTMELHSISDRRHPSGDLSEKKTGSGLTLA